VGRQDQGTCWGLGEVKNNSIDIRGLDARSARITGEGLSARDVCVGEGLFV
jgi:hypothetical protein